MHHSASRLSPADRERVIAVAKDINADILPNGLKSEVGVVRDIVVACSSGNIACRVYHPAQSASLGTVLLIHGGAWIAGSIDFHDNMARLLCSTSRAHVVSIEYSCAPDAMYPTQLQEIRSVIRWLSSAGPNAGLQPRPLAVCGDSAGGNMAAVIARESPANSIALVALINPIVDLTLAHLKVPEVRVFAEMMVSAYLPKDADASDPGLSPLLGAVPASHPPAFIAIGDSDPWRVEQELYAEKLQRTREAVVERGRPSGLDAARFALAERLFFRKLAAQLGLDRLKIAVSGAAPISRATLDFFARVGIVVHEVYGQSEGTGPTTFNRPTPGHRRLGTVGRPVPGVEVRLAPDGEIQARGRNIFLGYYKQPEATAEALVDGWLCSGDIGAFDADGYLQITDRKKDLIITAGGKNVAPQNLERMLKGIAGVSQAVVIGDRQPYLVALFTLDPERPASAQALQRGVDAVNAHLAQYETIKRFVVLPGDFSVEGGELTPTQKVKRKAVSEKYAAEIAALYDAGQ